MSDTNPVQLAAIAKNLQIKNLQDAYALRDNMTVFYQRFHGFEPVQGYLCLIAYCGGGLKGYLPPSELGLEAPTEKDLHTFLRRPVPVRVRRILREKNLIVLSRRLAVEYLSRRLWETVYPGQEVEGIVVSPPLPKRPLLLDLGGAVAEVPPEELSWTGWEDVKELMKEYPLYGEARAVVISADSVQKKIVASTRALKPDPWQSVVPERYPKGAVRSGVVAGTNHTGVFVRFFDGTLCLCSGAKGLKPGEQAVVRIRRVDHEKRRISGVIMPPA